MSDISFVYVSGTLDRAMGQTKKKVYVATAQVGYTSKPPDARRNGRTQELRDSCSREVGGPIKAHTLEKNAYKIQFHKD